VTAARPAETVGARLDRLPWSRTHLTILLALGAGWLFDSFEVQVFSSAVGPLGDSFRASVFARDAVLAVWLGGILLGALVGGRLTDRFGRRRLFVLTLIWYSAFTVLTGLAPSLGWVYALRFLAALGVGAEYAIVNAAIAEFMPARVRGRANAAVMNFWPAGAVLAALMAYALINWTALSTGMSWRAMFVVGGLVALVVLFFRRRIPESPRWLAARGRTAEAEAVVADLERASGTPVTPGLAAEPASPRLGAALRELVRDYPGRLALGASLDLAEAFGYYGLFALLSVVVLPQVSISQGEIPFFYIIGNVGAVAGGLVMSAYLDRLGRRRTVALCYGAAAVGVGLLAAATATGSAAWVTAAFVLANAAGTAAWTSAYPTFTELFPTHLRGAGVGFSVAVGRIGAIVGTLLLPSLATAVGATASYALVVVFWLAGTAAMLAYARSGGPEAARRPLESLTPVARTAAPSAA
jgi:MFS family permease